MYNKEVLELYSKLHAEWKKDCKEGPWTHEPDLYDFEYNGYKCYMIRSVASGAWCGYVKIPKSIHLPFDVDDLNAHGGITWDESRLPLSEEETEYRYIGFDCGHSHDYMPKIQKTLDNLEDPFLKQLKEHALQARKKLGMEGGIIYDMFNPVYRDMNFVIKELQGMVDQIRNGLEHDTKETEEHIQNNEQQ